MVAKGLSVRITVGMDTLEQKFLIGGIVRLVMTVEVLFWAGIVNVTNNFNLIVLKEAANKYVSLFFYCIIKNEVLINLC